MRLLRLATACLIAHAFLAPALWAQTVGGRVFLDENANGRLDADEKGLADVPVTDGLRFARSDAEGRYAIDAAVDPLLPAGVRPILTVSFPSGTWPVGGWFRRLDEAKDPRSVDFPLRPDEQKLPFIFVHATDPHARRKLQESLTDFRKEMGQYARDVRFCIMTGDHIGSPDKDEFAKAREDFDFLTHVLRGFPTPLFCVPGNHDQGGIAVLGGGWDVEGPMYGYGYYWRCVGPLRWSFDYAGLHLVGIDFMHREEGWWVWGAPASAVEWLDRDLAQVRPGARILLFIHLPLGEGLEPVIRRHRVAHVFAGHTHTVGTAVIAGIPRTLSGSLGVATKSRPMGYRIVRVEADGIESFYKPLGQATAIRIDTPGFSGRLWVGEGIRGAVLDADPAAAIRKVTVRLDGAMADAALGPGPLVRTFQARFDPPHMKPGLRMVEAVASDASGKTWSVQQKCLVLPGVRPAAGPDSQPEFEPGAEGLRNLAPRMITPVATQPASDAAVPAQ